MIEFKKEIEDFANTELKEAVVVALLNNETFNPIISQFKTSRANTNLIKQNFLDYIYEHNRDYFNSYIEQMQILKTMRISDVNETYTNLVREVLYKYFRKHNMSVLIKDKIIVQEDFYIQTMEYIKKQHLPISIKEIAVDLGCNVENVKDVITYHHFYNAIVFDENNIYNFKAGAYVIVDSIAQELSADLPELYKKIVEIVKELPKPLASYDKFVSLINTKLVNKKSAGYGLDNFLRIGKGKEGIVTRKKAFELYRLDEELVERIIENSIKIAQNVECSTDSEYILSKLKEKMSLEINPYILKSILVQSGEFQQGRKFNVVLKDVDCKFKRLDELVDMAFEKTKQSEMRARDIHEIIEESGKSVKYHNLFSVLKKYFKLVKKDNKETSIFSKERIIPHEK